MPVCPLRALPLIMALGVAACAVPVDDPERAALESAIAGGELDSTHRNVFGTVSLKDGRAATCTATLIAPNLLVTARHCVSYMESSEIICGDAAFGELIEPSEYIATNAVELQTSRSWYRAEKLHVPGEGNDTCGFDIALVTLSENVPATVATPAVPRIDRGVTSGEEYVAVGYGIDEQGNTRGRSLLTGLEVLCDPGSCGSGVRVTEFRGSSGVCEGDSGGPALDLDGKVVGVVSRGAAECTWPVYGAISAWSEWIQSVALEAAESGGYEPPFWATSGVSEPGAEPGNPANPSTPGAPGEPALGGQGDACSSGAECRSGFGCYQPSDEAAPFCVERCAANADCPGSSTCTSVGNGQAMVCLERRLPGPLPGAEPEAESEAGCSYAARPGTAPAAIVTALALGAALAARRRRRA